MQFIKGKGKTSMEQLSNNELQEFADEIKIMRDGTIGEYNAGMAEEIFATAADGLEAGKVLELTKIAVGADEIALDIGLIYIGL